MHCARRLIITAAAFITLLATTSAPWAQPVADFYRGKTVRLIIGYGSGGSYDFYGRLAAEFLGRHIPGTRPSSR